MGQVVVWPFLNDLVETLGKTVHVPDDTVDASGIRSRGLGYAVKDTEDRTIAVQQIFVVDSGRAFRRLADQRRHLLIPSIVQLPKMARHNVLGNLNRPVTRVKRDVPDLEDGLSSFKLKELLFLLGRHTDGHVFREARWSVSNVAKAAVGPTRSRVFFA
jgi:hypothetical protein